MKKEKHNRFKLSVIKHNALKLNSTKQLPHYLVKCILSLNEDSDIKLVTYLMRQSEHLLRIKGYYKKYSALEEAYSEQLKNDLHKMGYTGL